HHSSLMVRIDRISWIRCPCGAAERIEDGGCKWDILQTCEIAHETLHRRGLEYAVRLRELFTFNDGACCPCFNLLTILLTLFLYGFAVSLHGPKPRRGK